MAVHVGAIVGGSALFIAALAAGLPAVEGLVLSPVGAFAAVGAGVGTAAVGWMDEWAALPDENASAAHLLLGWAGMAVAVLGATSPLVLSSLPMQEDGMATVALWVFASAMGAFAPQALGFVAAVALHGHASETASTRQFLQRAAVGSLYVAIPAAVAVAAHLIFGVGGDLVTALECVGVAAAAFGAVTGVASRRFPPPAELS